jgi:MFS family permease
MHVSDWKKNVIVFRYNSIFNWYQGFIGVWVLIWTRYLSFTQIGIIYSVGLLASVLLDLPTGSLADLIGRKKTVIIGRFVGIVGYIIFSFANNFWLFILAEICIQVNWTFESGAHSALLYDSLKENGKERELYKKTETDTFFYCTVIMIFGSISGGLLYKYNMHLPYVACAITAAISFVLTFLFDEPKLDTQKFTFKNYINQNVEGVKHIFSNNKIKAVTFFSLLISFITYTGLWYLYEPRLTEGKFNPELLGLLVAGTYLIRAVGIKLIPVLNNKLRDKHVPQFLIVTQIIGSALSFIPNQFGAISSVYMRKFLDGFRMPILATLQNDNIESQFRATALSAISLSTNILVALSGFVIGYSIEHYSAASTLGFFAIIGVIIGVPLAFKLSKEL